MKKSRFDAPFWGLLAAGLVLVGTLGMIGLAAAAQSSGSPDPGIIVVGES